MTNNLGLKLFVALNVKLLKIIFITLKNRIPIQYFVFLTGITYCLFLFGLGEKLTFLTSAFGRLFAWTPGDIYDGSLNNWFLENNLQYFLNGGNLFNISEIFNASLYWPEKNTLAMSDNWILITPIYGILRTFLSPNFAFTGIIILSLTANMMACYHLCRHATEQKVYRLLASFLSAFSLTVLARLGHSQLMPAFAGVMAIDSFIGAVSITKLNLKSNQNSKNNNSRNEIKISISKTFTGIIWLFLQIGIGFYQGAFFAIASFCLLIVLILNRLLIKNGSFRFFEFNYIENISKLTLALKFVIFTILVWLNGLIYWQYFLYSRNQGGRSWGEVSSMIPKFWSFWFNTLSNPTNVGFPAPVQSINSNSYPGPFWEHSMFPGYTFMVLLFVGIWFGLRGSKRVNQNQNIKWRVMKLSQVCLLMLLITIGFGGSNPVLTFWLLIWKLVPGASALRGVSRIGIPIVLILSPLIAWTLSELHYRLDRKSIAIMMSFLLMLYLSGNITKGISRFDSTEYAAKKDSIVKKIEEIVVDKNCKSFYVKSPDTANWMYDRVHPQMMAMWASIKIGVPTSSGYSGNYPNEGWNHMLTKPQLINWLRKKGVKESDISNVCYIDGNEILN